MWEGREQEQEVKNLNEKLESINLSNKKVKESLDLNKFQEALQKTGEDLDLDFDNASLADAQQKSKVLDDNIASLISALDGTTTLIDDDFKVMRQKTGMEKFIGVFSSSKSNELRSKRVSESSIADKLQDLILQSEGIVNLLQKQDAELKEELNIGNDNIQHVLKLRQETVDGLQEKRQKMNDLDPIIMELESQIVAETNPSLRTKLEDKLASESKKLQDLKNEEAILLTQSQSLEKYIEQNKVHIKSLSDQKTSQQVLIEKIKLDTSQRVILYHQYSVSLKTAQQQETAHKIVELGSKVDKATQVGMAQIGSAASNALIDMIEGHKDEMELSLEIGKQQKIANERFNRRFAVELERHNNRDY